MITYSILIQQISLSNSESLQILERIYFELDSTVLSPRSYPVLDDIVNVLRTHDQLRIRVEGHTDTRGADDANVRLSTDRATSVVHYLTAHGIDAARLQAVGYGEDFPIIPNAQTEEEHAQNRRVEFKIMPNDF